MAVWVRDGSTWKPIDSPNLSVRDGSVWKPVKQMWVRDGGAWKSVYIQSDPVTNTYDLLGWGRSYYGTDGQSGKIPDGQSAKGNYAFRYGWGFNSEDEVAMLGFAAGVKTQLQNDIAVRPVISKITLKMNSQHTQNSAAKTCYFGWHDQTTEPALFSRLHTENQSGWTSGAQSIPHNLDNDGTEFQFDFPSNVHATIAAQIALGNIAGITGSWSAASTSADWGWISGLFYCTDEVSGGCGGSWLTCAGNIRRPRLEITMDYI